MTSRILVPIAAAALTAVLTSGTANADKGGIPNDHSKHGGPSSVPELTIGAAGGAFVILAGATLITLGRRRRSQKK